MLLFYDIQILFYMTQRVIVFDSLYMIDNRDTIYCGL